MIHRNVVELQMTQAEAEKYIPPAGINVIWLEWQPEQGKVFAEFVCCDLEPDPILRKTGVDIRHELGTTLRNRVLHQNLGAHPHSPRMAMMVEHNLDSPLVKDAPLEIKRAFDEATDIHFVEYTQEEAQKMQIESTGKHVFIPPVEVVQEKQMVRKALPGGHGTHTVEEYTDPRYRYKLGLIDIG